MNQTRCDHCLPSGNRCPNLEAKRMPYNLASGEYQSLCREHEHVNESYRLLSRPCDACRCSLPVDYTGYCRRCNEGWYGFISLNTTNVEQLQAELRLVDHAMTTEEVKGRAGSPAMLAEWRDKILDRLKNLSATT